MSVFTQEKIQGSFFINLKHRTDRLEEFYNQLDSVGIPRDKVERFDAILLPEDLRYNGNVGCNMSHLAALKLARERGYKNVLIFEDDLDFLVTREQLEENINNFFTMVESEKLDWKVVMLGYQLVHSKPFYDTKGVKSDFIGITNDAHFGSCYLVNSTCFDELIERLEYGTEMLIKTSEHWNYQNDQVWKSLQKDDKWFYFLQRIGKQRLSYSDLSKCIRDHGGM
jgi:GR25 family glycosyltransferase involved in LPS biosynthesis